MADQEIDVIRALLLAKPRPAVFSERHIETIWDLYIRSRPMCASSVSDALTRQVTAGDFADSSPLGAGFL